MKIQSLGLSFLFVVSLSLIACNQQVVRFNSMSQSQNFAQSIKYNNKVDFLWVIDNSTSMQQHQTKLSQQIDDFSNGLLLANIDFHLGVISTDVFNDLGKLIGSPTVLTNSTPSFNALLKDRFVVGENGSNMEQGLDAMYLALSGSNLKYANSGFLRDDAVLVVVVLSDEEDHSSQSVDYYANYLDQLKPIFPDGARGWMMHFIGVAAMNTMCTTLNDFSSVGLKYIDMAQRSGGIVGSICESDLRFTLENIKARIIEILTDYKLERQPVVASIQVTVNGVRVPQDEVNGWTYLTDTLTIRFHGSAVPPADAVIQVTFDPSYK